MNLTKFGVAPLIGSGLVLLFLANEFRKELNPWTGFWVVESATLADKEVTDDFGRVFLKMTDSGYGRVASYWTCGVVAESYAHGKIFFKGNEIQLIKEDLITRVREKEPRGVLLRLPNHRLGYDLPLEEGICRLEFSRESNSETVFDILGWD